MMDGFGWIFMIVFWGLAIVGIVAITQWVIGGRSWKPNLVERTALDVLNERYARGEIEREEFEQKRRDLER